MLGNLRQNLFLKVISIIASITLYIYVQSERHPTITRPVISTVRLENLGDGLVAEAESPQIEIQVTGPRQLVERIKDTDIHTVVDLTSVKGAESKTVLVPPKLTIMGMPVEMIQQLSLETSAKYVKVHIFSEVTRPMAVEVRFPKEPPAGFHYGRPDVTPNRVAITGRVDILNRIDRLIVNASPAQPGSSIDGSFPVVVLDSDGKPVSDTLIKPETVRVVIPLIEEPYVKIVTVSPLIGDQPMPPYQLLRYTVTPNQVRILGKPANVNQVFTLQTEEIMLRDMTETQHVLVNLTHSPEIEVRDMDGKPIKQVNVTLYLRKLAPNSAAQNPPAGSPGGHVPEKISP